MNTRIPRNFLPDTSAPTGDLWDVSADGGAVVNYPIGGENSGQAWTAGSRGGVMILVGATPDAGGIWAVGDGGGVILNV